MQRLIFSGCDFEKSAEGLNPVLFITTHCRMIGRDIISWSCISYKRFMAVLGLVPRFDLREGTCIDRHGSKHTGSKVVVEVKRHKLKRLQRMSKQDPATPKQPAI